MLEIIKKTVGTLDYMILIIAIYMLGWHLDYSNLDIVQTVYLVSFVLWFVMLAARIFILYRNEVRKK